MLNKAEQLQLKIISLQEKMQRYENKAASDAVKVIDELEKKLAIIMIELGKGHKSTRKKRLAEIKKQGQKEIQEAYKEIKRYELGFYDDDKVFQQGEFHEYAKIESNQTAKIINESDIDKPIIPITSDTAVNAVVSEAVVTAKLNRQNISRPIDFWWDKQSASTQENFILQMEDGINAGENLSQLSKRLIDDDGVTNVSKGNARLLARTATNAIGNNAALETFRKNSDVIEGVMWATTLDKKTCIRCVSHSDLRWTLEKKPVGHSIPFKSLPLHVMCRCVYVPVIIDFPEMSNVTYADWFKRQTQETQEEIMGVTKRRMWAEGKLKLSEIVDDEARVLNLEQLSEIGIKLLD